MKPIDNYYIYLHRRLSDNKVFYVGKGKLRRHLSRCGRNVKWNNIVNKHGFKSEIVYENLNEIEAFELEKDTIIEMRYHFQDYMSNMTDGGEGTSGNKQSAETIAKRISKIKGQKFSPAIRLRMSEAQKGKIMTQEARQKMSNAQKGKKISPEVRLKISASSLGRIVSLCTRMVMSEAQMDKSNYLFFNLKTSVHFYGTRTEFLIKFNIKRRTLQNYMNPKSTRISFANGWTIKEKYDNITT